MMATSKRRVCGAVALAAVVWCGYSTLAEERTPKAENVPQLGMNLHGPCDWNTELPFVDVFRMSRPWISQTKGQGWGKGPELSLDEHGWVTRLEPDCWAETLLCTIDGGHYPAGQYTVLYEGDGKLDVGNAARVVSSEPGRMVINVDSSKGTIFLKLLATDPQNPVRNIRVIMPGFETTYRENPFHPVFLRRWQGVACVRFMDWMETNSSKIRQWSERPTPADATFSAKGVPLEGMIDLCNRLQADPWFCMPHQADDDFVRRFAQMVHQKLAPKRKVYVEYSNEVWNGMFAQSRYAGEQGKKLGLADKPWEAAWHYTAYRSMQIFQIWEDVFGGTKRLVRVLPTQAAVPHVSEQVAGFQKAYEHADALAIAPYISCNVPKAGKKLTADEVANWTVDQVLDHLEQKSLPESIGWIKAQKAVADKYNLRLIAYEGGQHMVGVQGGENNEKMNALFHTVNRHPRMGDVYRQYFDAWTAAGGQLFCYFSSVGRWSKWGSWGILEHYDDNPARSPKFMATMRWARQCGQPVSLPE